MEAEKRQKKKAIVDATSSTSTPQKKKTRRPEKLVIGSSSTWKEEQLELYRVVARDGIAREEMIPEKWFEFSGLEEYRFGTHICWVIFG